VFKLITIQIFTYIFCLILIFTAVENVERDLKILWALSMQMMESAWGM
jgi:hypothetical protein